MDKPKQVLVVDDEEEILKVLRKYMKALGHEVVTARNGIEALDKLTSDIKLVLIDVKMPDMDGIEVTRQIKNDPQYHDLPIIIVTGHSTHEDRLRAVEAGADDFIAKPLDFNEIRLRTDSLLQKKEAQDALKQHQSELEETVLKRTAELRESEERFRIVSEITSDFAYAYRIEPDGELILDWVTGSLERQTGFNSEEIEQKGGLESFIHPDDLNENSRKFQTLMSGETTVIDYRILRKDDEIRWMRDFGRPEYDEKLGRVTHIYGAVKNITKRKRAEEELKKKQEELEIIINSIRAIIFYKDREGRFIRVNKALAELTGIPMENWIGKTVYDLSLETAETYTKDDAEVMTSGKAKLGIVEPLESLDGIRTVLTDKIPIKDENGKVTGLIGLTIDITDRKQAEEELERSREQLRNLTAHIQAAREQERTAIAREIHDELGQALTALKIDISELEKRFSPDQKSLIEMTESMKKLIDSTADVVDRISTELRPGLLDDLGLIEAIDWQAGEFQKRTEIECEISSNVTKLILEQDLATAVFRIFQETLTNIARHSQASKVVVEFEKNDDKLQLKVKDNGIGITKSQISDPKSYGLIGMRERALYLGGDLVINGRKDKGTTVTAIFPLENSGETT